MWRLSPPVAAKSRTTRRRRHIIAPDTYERIGSDHLLCLRRETIEAAAQINRAAGKKHLRAWCQADHVVPFIARSTRDSACSLTKASTQTRAPFGNAISMSPAPPPLI